MVANILKDLDLYRIAYHTTKGNHYTDDLHQELYLYLFENMERVIDLHNRGELKPYVYRMAWQTYNGRLGQFYLKYRYRPEIEKETSDSINLYDIIEESNLTSIERHWLNVYIDHDCNKTWMEANTKICRKAITKNIKTIIDKCRK